MNTRTLRLLGQRSGLALAFGLLCVSPSAGSDWEPFRESVEVPPKAPVASRPTAKPTASARTSSSQTAQVSNPSVSVEEVAHQGHVIRLVHDKTNATLRVQYAGSTVSTVPNVGEYKNVEVTPSKRVALVHIWTNTPAKNCSSYVLVALPIGQLAGPSTPTVKAGFGACNSKLTYARNRRDSWDLWSLIAFRDDSAKVTVALPFAGSILITEQAARPCLFNLPIGEHCRNEYLSIAMGKNRGMPTGEERTGRLVVTSYLDTTVGRGILELDGKPFRQFPDVSDFHIETAIRIGTSDIYVVWLKPKQADCGHRLVLRSVDTISEHRILEEKIGECHKKMYSEIRRRPDQSIVQWFNMFYNDGDRNFSYVYWANGQMKIGTGLGDACLLTRPVSNDCIDRSAASVMPAPISQGNFASSAAPPVANSGVDGVPNRIIFAPPRRNVPSSVAKAIQLLSQGATDVALAEFDRVLMREPRNKWALTGRGYGLAMKRQFDSALADIDRALQIDPRFGEAYVGRGFVFLARLEFDRAIAQFDQALELDPKLAVAYVFRGESWLGKKDTGRAISDLDRAIILDPSHAHAYSVRAAAHAQRNAHTKAVQDYATAIQMKPTSIHFRLGHGLSLEALGRNDEAKAAYKAAMAIATSSPTDILIQQMIKLRLRAIETGDRSSNCSHENSSCL